MANIPQTQKLLFKALRNQFEAERDTAVAILQVYFDKPICQPTIIKEMIEQVQKLSDAEDNLETLKRNFIEYMS